MQQCKPLTILIFLLTLSTTLFSQNTLFGNVKGARARSTNPINDSSKSMAGCGSFRTITEKSEMPLFIIDDLLITPEFNERSRFINPENMAEVFVYQKNDSIAKSYGEIGKNGVIKIILKPDVKLIPLTEILKDFYCENYYPSMKVCIDGEFIKYPEKVPVDRSDSLYAFAIISSKKQIDGIINLNEQFVNVVTR